MSIAMDNPVTKHSLTTRIVHTGLAFTIIANHRTELGTLFPWLYPDRRIALWAGLKPHIAVARKLRLPDHDDQNPLASVVQGLGMLLMITIAATGVMAFALPFFYPQTSAALGLDPDIHRLLANLVWTCLIGRVGLAAIHHCSRNLSLAEIWALAANQHKESN